MKCLIVEFVCPVLHFTIRNEVVLTSMQRPAKIRRNVKNTFQILKVGARWLLNPHRKKALRAP